MKVATLRSAFFLIATVIGCSDHSALERQARATTTQHLIGTWDARFHLDRPLLVAQQAGSPLRDVSGQLAFLANHSVTQTYPAMPSPSDYGTFDIDFNPFGFDPRSDNETPTAEAWLGGDSLQVMLGDPTGDITVRMSGRVVGDSISGQWTVLISRTGGGGGRFVMLRHR
jgi:hypothetical protein